MLNRVCFRICTLIAKDSILDVNKIMIAVGLEKKRFNYELSLINEMLIEHNLDTIYVEKGIIQITDSTKKYLSLLEFVDDITNIQSYRKYLIYLFILSSERFVSNFHIQDFLNLSRNTIMLELKKLRHDLKDQQVKVSYSRKHGYYVEGEEKYVRKYVEEALSKINNKFQLVEIVDYMDTYWEISNSTTKIKEELFRIIQSSQYNVVQERVDILVYSLYILRNRIGNKKIYYNDSESREMENIPLFYLAKELTNNFFDCESFSEILFVETRLLSVLQDTKLISQQENFLKLTNDILSNFSALTGGDYTKNTMLFKTLYQHVVPAYFRIKYDIYYENPLLFKIKEEYKYLYNITERALAPLNHYTNRKVSDSEIAYFTIHFGGYLNSTECRTSYTAAIVCLHGISSSLIMRSTIQELFPEISVFEVYEVNEIKNSNNINVDMIFSTTRFETNKNIYVTKPLMNRVEKEILIDQVISDFPDLRRQSINLTHLMQIIEDNSDIYDKDKLMCELSKYLYGNKEQRIIREERNLNELLNESLIQITKEKLSWKESIKKAAEPLLDQQYITEHYIEAMIDSVEEIGPYIVLAPRVAVPHARPESGVKKLGMSLLKLDKPVNFNVEGENESDREVRLIFVLAAIDSSAHLKSLVQLADIIDSEKHVETLIKQNSPRELFETIDYLVKNKEE